MGTTLRAGVIAGAAGGLAEVFWVSLYSVLTGTHAATVARGVTTAVGATALLPDNAVTLGVAIHMAIAVALGVALAAGWQVLANVWPSGRPQYGLVVAALVGIWSMNFFVILPLVSPGFVDIVPDAVSLLSKLSFGLAAAETLRRFAATPAQAAYAGLGA